MRRWNRWAVTPFDEPDDLDSPGGSGQDQENEEDSSQTTSQDSPNPPSNTEVQSPFQHPSLAGLTEEQIAERLNVASATVRSQSQRLSALEQEIARRNTQQPTEPEDQDTAIDPTDFFKDPGRHVREITRGVVAKELREIVNPLLADVANNKINSAWEQVRKKHGNFDAYEDYIQEKLRAWGITEPTAQVIESVYYMGVGEAAASGNGNAAPQNPQTPNTQQQPTTRINPQHSPSSQPVNTPNDKKKTRKLTEEEKAYARLQGLTDEEFIRWSEVDESEVASFEIKD